MDAVQMGQGVVSESETISIAPLDVTLSPKNAILESVEDVLYGSVCHYCRSVVTMVRSLTA